MSNAVPAKEHVERALASCMVLVAGYLDGYGLLVLGTYVSFMSGNTTMTGVRAGQGNFAASLIPAIAIAAFVTGSAAGNLIKHSRLHHAPPLVFLLIAALLAAVTLVGLKPVDIALLGFAMGMVNPVLPKIGAESVSLTFMTGTLSRIGGHLGLALIRAPVPGSEGAWDTHLYRAGMDAQLWACFLVGAALSGAAISASRDYALWPAVAVTLLIALATSYAETREAEKGPSKAAEMGPLKIEPPTFPSAASAQARMATPSE